MTATENQYDIIVVGAGLIGSACALSLAKNTNYSIALVERSKPISDNTHPNQRVVALGRTATELLKDLDIFTDLTKEFCHAYDKMFVWDENSQGQLSFTAEDYQRPELGHIIDSVQCAMLLQQKVGQSKTIDQYYSFAAEQLNIEDHELSLCAQQIKLRAKLIIAADGNKSWVRRQAKIFAPSDDYKQKGIVATIRTGQPHWDTAWQRFLGTGPIAVLPLDDNKSSIVWTADNEYADQLLELDKPEFESALADALEQKLGTIELLSQPMAFPLKSIKADKYCKKRLVLIGDAAHSIHPLAGQGANLGFKDVLSLTSVLADADESSLGDLEILHKFQAARQIDNKQTDLLMTALHHGFKSESLWWASIRGQGMNVIGGNQLLRKMLVMGAAGD